LKLSEAYVEVKTNQKQFSKELKTMESSVKRSTERMRKNFARIGAGVSEISRVARYGFLGVTAAIAGSVYAFTKMGDTIHKMSIRTGVAATELSALGYAAQISGAELDTVERSLRYLSARMMDAETGLAEAKRAFDELDVSIVDTEGNLRPTIDVLIDVADKIAVMTNETEKSALAGEIFGMRYGPMLLPLLNEGSEGITKLMDKAKELGITIDTEAAAAAAEFNDRLTDMKGVLAALGREVGEVFLPVFRNTVVIIIDKVKEWRKAIDALTPQQKKLIAQVVLLGTATLGAVGALGLFAKLAVVVKAAGLIIAGTAGLIASPLGLIMLAVGALALAWAYNWGDIQGKTKAVWDFLKPIFQGIWDWLSDIGKEMENTTDTIKKETEKQGGFWQNLLKVFKVIGLAFWEIFKEMGAIAKEVLKAMGFDWDKFVKDLKDDIENIKYWFGVLKEWAVVKFKWTLEKVGEGWKWLTETLMPWLWTWSETTFHWALNLAGTVWDKFKGIMQWVKEHAVFYFNWALIKIGETWDWLTDALWPWIKEWGVKAFEWGLKLVGDIWNWLKDTLIPWVKEWKVKAFEWTLNLLGDAWDKIQELLKWLKIIPEELEGVVEAAEKTGEAIKKIAPAEVIKDLSYLIPIIRGQKLALEEASKGWGTYNQVAKRQIAATAANFILFEHEITDLAAKAPLEFAEEFQKAFMKAEPKIQKAILDALTARDFQRAVDLAGIKAGHIFLHGRSPGGIIGELEEGQKDLGKQLDKMLGSMDAMTKKMMVIFQPIIGLFRTIFEAMLKIIEKFSPEAAAEIRALVDDIMGMMEGLFDIIEGEADDLPDKMKPGLDKAKSLWQKFCEAIKSSLEEIGEAMEDIGGEIKSAFSNAIVSILTGAKSMDEAFSALGNTIRETVIKALVNVAIQAAIMGNVVLAVIAGIGAAIISLGHHVEETVYSSSEAFLNAIRETEDAIAGLVGSTIAGMRTMAAEIAVEFEKMGHSMSRTIEEAERKLEALHERQADLQSSTREKLISELDKYYDYRMLRELSLDELLALSAETRVKIEEGTIEEIEESEEEQERRRKDREINRLKRIEEQYAKEEELIRRKIALTEIEIKLLEYRLETEAHGNSARAKMLAKELEDMLAAYKESVEAFKEAEEEKQEAVEDTTEVVKEETGEQAKTVKDAAEGEVGDVKGATERMGEFWNDLTADMRREAEKTWGRAGVLPMALNEAVNAMIGKIGELPTRIDFDVIGNLHMPVITAPGPFYFDIFGSYHAPSIPSAQIGIPYVPRAMPVVVHREEAILNPPQAREWRRGGRVGGAGGMQVIYERGSIRMTVMGSINRQVDLEEAMDYLAQKQAEKMRRP